MSPKLPRVTATQIIKAIEKLGYKEARSSGSHRIYKNLDKKKRIVIPFHSGKIIHPKIIRDILQITNLSLEELIDLL